MGRTTLSTNRVQKMNVKQFLVKDGKTEAWFYPSDGLQAGRPRTLISNTYSRKPKPTAQTPSPPTHKQPPRELYAEVVRKTMESGAGQDVGGAQGAWWPWLGWSARP
jgi:hypothetical protein